VFGPDRRRARWRSTSSSTFELLGLQGPGGRSRNRPVKLAASRGRRLVPARAGAGTGAGAGSGQARAAVAGRAAGSRRTSEESSAVCRLGWRARPLGTGAVQHPAVIIGLGAGRCSGNWSLPAAKARSKRDAMVVWAGPERPRVQVGAELARSALVVKASDSRSLEELLRRRGSVNPRRRIQLPRPAGRRLTS
jgi:hypothetical protein